MTTQGVRRIATYERVSSEDQRERETIKTQGEEIARKLQIEPGVELVERYVDDGVSGTVPMARRPAGRRLLEDATKGLFDEVWIFKVDRLGRDGVDPLVVWRDLESLGVRVHSVTEGISDPFMYSIYVAVAAQERRSFLERSRSGLERAVREGRYVGGIRPYGYTVEGERHQARLVPDERIVWGDLTPAEVVRRIFEWAADGWSTLRIADELNRRGVPTRYELDGRGIRGKATRREWTAGRVQQLLDNTTYRGEYHYGKRSSKRGRPMVVGEVPSLVSRELWDAAHDSMRGRRRKPARDCHRYLLRSLIRCDDCGLNFTGSRSHGDVWYRCNGQLVRRQPVAPRCHAVSIKGDYIEPVIRADIERWLRNPGDLIDELSQGFASEAHSGAARVEAERLSLEAALAKLDDQINRLLDLYLDEQFDRETLGTRLSSLKLQRGELRGRIDALAGDPPAVEPCEQPDVDLLEELRAKVDAGLSEDQWHELVTILVGGITVRTTFSQEGRKLGRITIDYRFDSVVNSDRGTGSSRRQA